MSDKKTVVSNLYQGAVISVFAVGYSMLGTKVLKMTPPSIQKFDLNETGKADSYHHHIRYAKRVPHQTGNSTGTH